MCGCFVIVFFFFACLCFSCSSGLTRSCRNIAPLIQAEPGVVDVPSGRSALHLAVATGDVEVGILHGQGGLWGQIKNEVMVYIEG